MKLKFRDALQVDFSNYNLYAPTERQAVAYSIYSLSASLIAEYLGKRKRQPKSKMPEDLFRLRSLLKNMWYDPSQFICLQEGDKAGIETSLLAYCEDWIDLYAHERDARYNKIRDVIYYSNTLFAKIFMRSMHHEAMKSKIIESMIVKPAMIEALIKPKPETQKAVVKPFVEETAPPPRRRKKVKEPELIEFTPLERIWHKSFETFSTPP